MPPVVQSLRRVTQLVALVPRAPKCCRQRGRERRRGHAVKGHVARAAGSATPDGNEAAVTRPQNVPRRRQAELEESSPLKRKMPAVVPASSSSFCSSSCQLLAPRFWFGWNRQMPWLERLNRPRPPGRFAPWRPAKHSALAPGDHPRDFGEPGVGDASRPPAWEADADEADWRDGDAMHGLHDLSRGFGPR